MSTMDDETMVEEPVGTADGDMQAEGDMQADGDMLADEVSEERSTGQVKWFNDIEKYGFICPTDGSADIFVHLTDLSPAHNHAKPTLYTGEYVSFNISTNGMATDGSVRIKAVDVKGVFGDL